MIFGKKWHRFFVTVGRPTPVKARLCRGPSDQEVGPRQRQFSLPLKLWGSSALSQSTTQPNLVICSSPQNKGLTRGKTPQTPTAHAPFGDRHKTPDTNSARALRRPSQDTRHQQRTRPSATVTRHQTPTAHAPFGDRHKTPDTNSARALRRPSQDTRHQQRTRPSASDTKHQTPTAHAPFGDRHKTPDTNSASALRRLTPDTKHCRHQTPNPSQT
jgi:hypothetical protein